MPVPAPVAGVIVEFLVPNNGKVGAKQVVVKIKPGGALGSWCNHKFNPRLLVNSVSKMDIRVYSI